MPPRKRRRQEQSQDDDDDYEPDEPEPQTPTAPLSQETGSPADRPAERRLQYQLKVVFPERSEGWIRVTSLQMLSHKPAGDGCADCEEQKKRLRGKCKVHRLTCTCKARFESRSAFRNHLSAQSNVRQLFSLPRKHLFPVIDQDIMPVEGKMSLPGKKEALSVVLSHLRINSYKKTCLSKYRRSLNTSD